MTTIRRADDVASTLGKAANIALWTLQVLVALAFVAAGSGKLLGTADMIALFQAVSSARGSDMSPVCSKCWARSCSSSLARPRSARCCWRA